MTVLNVLYDHEQQIDEMVTAVGDLFLQLQDRGSRLDDSWLRHKSAMLAASSVALKNPAWRDEKEIRCQHVVDVKIGPDGWTLIDEGGSSAGRAVEGEPIDFQVRRATIVPFLDMPFLATPDIFPIEEIVLGPKCPNAYESVWFLLGNNGCGKIPLRTAGGAYR